MRLNQPSPGNHLQGQISFQNRIAKLIFRPAGGLGKGAHSFHPQYPAVGTDLMWACL